MCLYRSTVICAWGEDGAAATHTVLQETDNQPHKETVFVPIHSPPKVVDTLGAGDTFNAATIYSLCCGNDIKDAITFGCRVAGTKCGLQGFWGLKDFKFSQ